MITVCPFIKQFCCAWDAIGKSVGSSRKKRICAAWHTITTSSCYLLLPNAISFLLLTNIFT